MKEENSTQFFTDLKIPDSKLEPLRPVVQNWFKLLEKYQSICDLDYAYWWNERASTGILGSAANLTEGFCALEEYSLTKSRGDNSDTKQKKEYQGRNDLFIANEEIHYYCEAKNCFPKLADCHNEDKNKIKEAIKDAENSSASLNKNDNELALAISFIAPTIPTRKVDGNTQNKIKEMFKKFENSLVAAFFNFSELLDSEQTTTQYPGVYMVMQIVEK